MRVGTVCYDTVQGIGIMAKQFYDEGIVTDPVVVAHGRRPAQGWYPDAYQMTNVRDLDQQLEALAVLSQCDVCIFFETPFIPGIIARLRAKGVRSVLVPMHECTPKDHEAPDLYLCPSETEYRLFPKHKSHLVQIPVYLSNWRRRGEIRTFVHNAGHGGLKGRNGTAEVCEAIKLITRPCKFILRSQEQKFNVASTTVVEVDQRIGTVPHYQLYQEGEAFVFPEHFQGQSYPLEEAYAAGMVVMALDRPPMNNWLPRPALIPVTRTWRDSIGSRFYTYDAFASSPEVIAKSIDALVGIDSTYYGDLAMEWAKRNTWHQWKQRYRTLLESVC